MDAWADTGEKKSFGYIGFIKFTFPRLWRGNCCRKFIVLFNFICVLTVKLCQVTVPLILREAVDAIVCDRSEEGNECVSEQ